MKCPTCGEHTPDSWQWFSYSRSRLVRMAEQDGVTERQTLENLGLDEIELPGRKKMKTVAVSWMRCANKDCDELLMRATEGERVFVGPAPMTSSRSWIVWPRSGSTRMIDPAIPEHYRRDFSEADSILDRSPRMSAVLSRRILADLLEEFASKAQFGLADRIDSFNEDTRHPFELRKNLHYLREIADMSAHTKKNDQAEVIEVEAVEAAWTLDVVERLFDYFIVSRHRDRAVREAVDKKVAEAKRRPVKPLPDEPMS